MSVLAQPVLRVIRQRPSEVVSIRRLVADAADVISPVWPLRTFAAVNPLQGLERLPFEQAVATAERLRRLHRDSNVGREAVNREMIKWCVAFFDEGQAVIPMPGRERGLYAAFADLARFDRRLTSAREGWSIELLPAAPEAAIEESLRQLRVPMDQWEEFLRQELSALPGWAGYVKWKESWQRPADGTNCPATLVEFVAVRLAITRLLWPEARYVEDDAPEAAPALLMQLPIAERRYRAKLVHQLAAQARATQTVHRTTPEAQVVFCIDVRSEPIRRALEAQGPFETYGFAGFFGLPLRVRPMGSDCAHDSCPVLLKAGHEVAERPAAGSEAAARRAERRRRMRGLAQSVYQWLKYTVATPFALVEMLGPWMGLRMLGRSFAPGGGGVWARPHDARTGGYATEFDLEDVPQAVRVEYAEGALRTMGLTQNFAPLVVFCGHGSTTANNPYAAALDCGACGGNHGGANGQVLAQVLDEDSVRRALAARGIEIPDDTWFVGAEHDTTTDRFEILGRVAGRADQVDRVARLCAALRKAARANAITRTGKLEGVRRGGRKAMRVVRRRSMDWAEVRPEWGLARNAAFVVGPRSLTKSLDLEGRCFLHSYDWAGDEDGRALSTILTAPMVVAQWINAQYLFSTVDNVRFGSGSKITQNVVGKLGVMQGNASDLMHGLPLQSVYASDDRPYHEPLRLLTTVYAPRERVARIVGEQEVLQKLIGNGWVSLVCIDPVDQTALLMDRDRTWVEML